MIFVKVGNKFLSLKIKYPTVKIYVPLSRLISQKNQFARLGFTFLWLYQIIHKRTKSLAHREDFD